MSGFGISGLIFNNLALWLVNPQHEQASEDGQYEKQVYDNVPYMLQTLAYCYAALVITATLLVTQGPIPETDFEEQIDQTTEQSARAGEDLQSF